MGKKNNKVYFRQGKNKKPKGYKKTRFILKIKKTVKTFAIP